MKSVLAPFKAPWWLPDGHSQTLWRKFWPGAAPRLLPRQRQRLELGDGDFVDLDWASPVTSAEADPQLLDWLPVVVILHGLCGCSSSPYVLSLQHVLSQHGYRSAALNFRSCSGEPNRLARAYHSGASDDLEEVLCLLRQQMPGRRFAAAGYSLGANVLLKWLGERPRPEPLTAAIAVSTPFSLALCSGTMKSGLSRLYGQYFLQRLRADMKRKELAFEATGNSRELEKLRALGDLDRLISLWDFDEHVTAPLHGFRDASDYYAQSSSEQFLADIRSPTLIIHGVNDPIIPPQAVPDARSLPEPVTLELLPSGGHVGFIAAGQEHWLDYRILHFIEQQQGLP